MTTSSHDNEQQLISIVQQLLSESGTEYTHRKVTVDASLQRHLGIDSLGRAELFQRIEKQFDIRLPDNLIAEADTLKDVLKAIQTASPGHKIQSHESFTPLLEKSSINPQHAKTLVDALLLHATGDPERPHIYFQDEHGKEEVITYGKLYENGLRVAHELIKRGLKPGETIAIMQPTNPGFFYTFAGVLLANCIPVPIYPPLRPHQIEAYAKQEAKILRNAEVRMLVTFHEAEHLSKLLRVFIPSLKHVTTVNSLLKNDEKAPFFGAKADDFALIQYTSGSTSAPKGVLLTHQNLLSNIRTFGEFGHMNHQDVLVSWVPLYHDLGLIGMWLSSLYHGIPLVVMSPLTFLTRPERWLWAIHYHRGTISGGPNFAYELCIRKIEPEQIEGLDLSSWRAAVNAAEAIQPKTMERFTEKFAPYGFKPEAHRPAYGLAESTVCLTVGALGRPPRIDKIDRKAFEKDMQAIATAEENGLEFVACGKPLPNHFMRIVDESGNELPERHIGQLQFKGPSSMQGYYGNPEATMAIYHDGWWDSGDLCYIADEELFVTGRKKDVIIKAGRNLYPSELEELTSQVPDIRRGCVIAFGTIDTERGTEKLIIVAETRIKKPKNAAAIANQVTEIILNALDVAPDQVILIPPQSIPKTSSGKLQRAACKASYLAGKLTKRRTPLWLQLSRIGFTSILVKLRHYLANIFKFFYTIYFFLLISISVPLLYIFSWILPQRWFARVCKIWAKGLFLFAICPISTHGKKHLSQRKPVIYAPNHSSYIDPLLLLAILPSDTRFIGKQEIADMPIVGRFARKLGVILVNRVDMSKGVEDTKEMESTLRDGHSLMIFPEGTFSYAAGLRPFRAGAFKIASETNTPICSIAIQGTRAILRGEERLLKPGSIKITVNEPMAPHGKEWQDINNFKNKIRALIAKDCGEPSLDLITTRVSED